MRSRCDGWRTSTVPPPRTHAHAHAHARTRTHTHTHTDLGLERRDLHRGLCLGWPAPGTPPGTPASPRNRTCPPNPPASPPFSCCTCLEVEPNPQHQAIHAPPLEPDPPGKVLCRAAHEDTTVVAVGLLRQGPGQVTDVRPLAQVDGSTLFVLEKRGSDGIKGIVGHTPPHRAVGSREPPRPDPDPDALNLDPYPKPDCDSPPPPLTLCSSSR
eukprot:scaffold14733_cov108-Isochrysis_galbana.AAC.1